MNKTKTLGNLDHKNEEIDDNPDVPNHVSNPSNIKNLNYNYEKEIPHLKIYDLRNGNNLNNKLNDIIVEKEPTK